MKCEELARGRNIEDPGECTIAKSYPRTILKLQTKAALKCASKEGKDVSEPDGLESRSICGPY